MVQVTDAGTRRAKLTGRALEALVMANAGAAVAASTNLSIPRRTLVSSAPECWETQTLPPHTHLPRPGTVEQTILKETYWPPAIFFCRCVPATIPPHCSPRY